MKAFSLQGKHILITGASGSIGGQCAVACSEAGAVLTLTGRNPEKLEALKSRLSSGLHRVIPADITALDSIAGIVEEAVNTSGKIDGFVHAAGFEKTLPLKMHKPEVMHDIMQLNVLAGLEFARVIALNKYVSPDAASFVFIASVMGVVGNPGITGYSAAKGALISACRSMSLELSSKNIRVNSLSPGYIGDSQIVDVMKENLGEENMKEIIAAHPLGLGETTDVAHAAVFLLSPAAKWITGINLIVDGGYTAR